MLLNNVSIILPIIRPEAAIRCIRAIHKNRGCFRGAIQIIAKEDKQRIGAPKKVKELVGEANYDLIMFLGDDTIPQYDFLRNAILRMKEFPDGYGLVGLNDQFHKGYPATHWLAHRELLEYFDGEFFHTGYRHCFCDNELTDRCIEMDRYVWAKDSVILHDHPLVKGESVEGTEYESLYRPDNYYHDQRLYKKRKANKWRT